MNSAYSNYSAIPEMELEYYHRKMNVRVALRDAEQRKT